MAAASGFFKDGRGCESFPPRPSRGRGRSRLVRGRGPWWNEA
jgi:hypothetical protein